MDGVTPPVPTGALGAEANALFLTADLLGIGLAVLQLV